MKKMTFLVFAMLFALLTSALQAKTDVTAQYLTNADFETAPIAFLGTGNTVNPDAASLQLSNSGLGSRVYVPAGWTAECGTPGSGGNAQYTRLATGLFGVDYTSIPDAFNGVEFPTSDRTGAFLALSGGYGTKPCLVQNVTLPAGQYQLQYDVYDQNPNKTFINLFGFVPNSGTAVYDNVTSFTASTWETRTVSFTIDAPTEGKISIGITGNSGNSGANAHLAVDNITLFFTDLNVALNETLTSLIATATALKDSTAVPATFDKTAIETAIANAAVAFASSDATDKQNAIDALNIAISDIQIAIAFANVVNMTDIVSGQKYNLRHVVTGMYLQFLDNGDGDFCINSMPLGGNANFDFIFNAVAGVADTYMLEINNGSNSGYMSGSGWNIQLSNPETATQKQIILLDQGDNAVRLRAGWLTGNVINVDNITPASRLYANKSGNENADFIIELSPNAFDMTALITAAKTVLQAAITEAQNLSKSTVNGSLSGQYTGKAAFTDAIAAANAVYNNAASALAELQDATATLLLAIETYKATRINPYTGYVFKLKHYSSENYVSKSTNGTYSNARIQPLDAIDNEQDFEFEEVAGITNGVRIKTSDGNYLNYSGYTSSWTTTPGTNSNLIVEEDASGFIKLKFAASNNYFGADGTVANESIFTDKDGSSNNHRWIMEIQDPRVILGQIIANAITQRELAVVGTGVGEYPQTAVNSLQNAIVVAQAVYDNSTATNEEIQAAQASLQNTLEWFVNVPVARASLYALITTANAKLNSATAGADSGNHPQVAIDAFTSAIVAAQAVCDNSAATDEQINAAKDALQDALDLFISQEICFSTAYLGTQYWIIHSSGNLLSKAIYNTNAVINDYSTQDVLNVFEFVAVPGQVDVVALKSSDGKYLSYNSWNTPWINSINSNAYMKISTTSDGYLNLKMVGNNLLGTDTDVDSTAVYANKSGNNILYKWQVQAPGSVIKIKLNATIVQSDTLLNHISAGAATFQFPAADYNAFEVVLSASKTLWADENATQAQIDAQVEALKTALETLYSKQNLPVFTPEASARYLVTNKSYSGYLTDNGVRAVVETNVPLAGWEILKLTDSTYVFKNGDLAMAQSLNMVTYAPDAPDQVWKLHYDGAKAYEVYTPDADHHFAFIGGANAMQFISGGQVQLVAGHSHSTQAQWFAINKIGAPITTALSTLIANVESVLSSAVVGTDYGQYLQTAKDSLTTALTNAQSALGNSATMTQAQINAAVTDLQNALTWFNNQKIVWQPAAGMAYFIGNRDNANYLSIDTLSASVAKGYKLDSIPFVNQLWFFAPVENKAGFYHIVNGKNSVGNSGGTSIFVEEYDAATAKEIEVKYQATANGIEYFLLTTTNTYPNIQIGSDGNVSSDRYTYNNYQMKLVAAGALRTEVFYAVQLRNSASVGNGIGQYTPESYDAFVEIINTSIETARDEDSTNGEAQLQMLKDAEDTFRTSQNGYGLDLNALLAAVEVANDLLETTTIVGSSAGQCPQTVVDALATAVVQSQDATGGINQEIIDQKVTVLNQAIADFKTALKASTGLTDLLAASLTQHNDAVEGTNSGQYAAGSKAIFKTAIDAAQLVFDQEPVVQSVLITAYNYLNEANDDFNAARVLDLYIDDLQAVITEVEAFLSNKLAEECAGLRAKLAEAQALLLNPDKTQEQIDAMTDELYEALEAEKQTGIGQLLATGIKVFTAAGALHISGLTEHVQVGIFNTLGQQILIEKVTGSDFVQPLKKGLYIVTVNSISFKVFIR
jgi:ElaB/YqjD/DUF883 family membrane-anchored ribosome-binding protein